MWSWHWPPLTQTSLILSPSDGLASFFKTTLANGVKVFKKVITSKFRFHLIAIYALGCFSQFQLHTCTKITLKSPPTPVRLGKEWILMTLIKKTINLKTVFLLIHVSDVFFFHKKKCHKMFGTPLCHLEQWLNFLLAQIFFLGQPKAGPHFSHCRYYAMTKGQRTNDYNENRKPKIYHHEHHQIGGETWVLPKGSSFCSISGTCRISFEMCFILIILAHHFSLHMFYFQR